MNARALIVNEEQGRSELIAAVLRDAGFDACCERPGNALRLVAEQQFDVVLTDSDLETSAAHDFCRKLSVIEPDLPIVVLTPAASGGTTAPIVGARVYCVVSRPIETQTILAVLKRAVEHHALQAEIAALRRVIDAGDRYGALLGRSDPMRRLFQLIERVKDADATLLITGESGTGKELTAREVHARGQRKNEPFTAFSCAATPDALLESTLFGHERGAFTDAHARREGLLLSAGRGTLLLDEIGDMPLALQSKLLRVLEERTFRPLGSNRELRFEARVIAATNRDLDMALEQGRFRHDLFHRLNVIHIDLPPLRSRGSDVLLLVQNFLDELCVRQRKPVCAMSPAAVRKLLAYHWPGNVRELRNCIEGWVALSSSDQLDVGDLPPKIRDYEPTYALTSSNDPSELLPLEVVERRYILQVVKACAGNKSKAACVLGIGRRTLHRRLEAMGIDFNDG